MCVSNHDDAMTKLYNMCTHFCVSKFAAAAATVAVITVAILWRNLNIASNAEKSERERTAKTVSEREKSHSYMPNLSTRFSRVRVTQNGL